MAWPFSPWRSPAQSPRPTSSACSLTSKRVIGGGIALLLGSASSIALGGPAPLRPPDEPNVVPLTAKTPRHGFNRLVVSVTLCAPGTDRCVRVDDVMVDTGSTGLRLDAGVIPPWLDLPPFTGPDGRPLGQCLRFVHDVAWGRLRRADLHIGGLLAADLPLQVMEDDAPSLPDACPRSDVRPTSNGTLGIGPEPTDCRGECRQTADRPSLFGCDAAGCAPLTGSVPEAYRLPNPVSRLSGYDNGIVVDLPPSPPEGAAEIRGTLTFGVGTAANNQLGPTALVKLDRAGRFTTVFHGERFVESTIDSGTPTYVLPGSELPRCRQRTWAFCSVPTASPSAAMIGADGASLSMSLRVGSYDAFAESGFGASDSVATAAEPSARAFVWGAPLFFGKRVFVVRAGSSVPGTPGLEGPLYAFGTRGAAPP